MKAIITRITDNPSKYGGNFQYVFFRDLQGNPYKTCLTPQCRNYRQWAAILARDDYRDITLDGLEVKAGDLIDADSVPVVVSEAADQPSLFSDWEAGRARIKEIKIALDKPHEKL